ncbi:MAG: hypothetical protein AAFU64_03925, partial [Bacteroidota bacterium]
LNFKFKNFLTSFESLFPKIYPKLKLLLKLQARIEVNEQELKDCFPGIRKKEIQQFLASLNPEQDYVRMEDKDLYLLAHPYFKQHRREKGSPAALQRWLNQHISGDKNSKGILDYLVIRDDSQVFRIQDKKFFADFLHLYFKAEAGAEVEAQVPSEKAFTFNNLKSQVWSTVVVSR